MTELNQTAPLETYPAAACDPEVVHAQGLLEEMKAAVNNPHPTANEGTEALRAFNEMGSSFKESLQGEDAQAAIAVLQEMANLEMLDDDIVFGYEGWLTRYDMRRAAVRMTLRDLSDTLMTTANENRGTEVAAAADRLLLKAAYVAPGNTKPETYKHLAHRMPDMLQEAIKEAEDEPTLATMASHDYTTGKAGLDVYSPSIRDFAEQFSNVVEQAKPEDAQPIWKVVREVGMRRAESPHWEAACKEIAHSGDVIYHACKLAGLPPEPVQRAWDIGYDRGKRADRMSHLEYRARCVQHMADLELARPGICKELFQALGIRNYGRFSVDLLVKQYEDLRKPFDERVYFISGTEDGNGSALYNSVPKLAAVIAELEKHGISGVITEVDRPHELRVRARMARMAGWGPVRFVFADVHGREDSLGLGEESLDAENARDWAGALLHDMTTEDAVTVLNSCDGGKTPNGIGASLAEGSGREIIATRAGTFLKALSLFTDSDGIVRFNVNIQYSKKWQGTAGTPIQRYGKSNVTGTSTAPEVSVHEIAAAVQASSEHLPLTYVAAAENTLGAAALRLVETNQGDTLGNQLTEISDRLSGIYHTLTDLQQSLQNYISDIGP